MNRTDALDKLHQHADAVRGMGATALYLFGSTVRDEAQAASDLDLFIGQRDRLARYEQIVFTAA